MASCSSIHASAPTAATRCASDSTPRRSLGAAIEPRPRGRLRPKARRTCDAGLSQAPRACFRVDRRVRRIARASSVGIRAQHGVVAGGQPSCCSCGAVEGDAFVHPTRILFRRVAAFRVGDIQRRVRTVPAFGRNRHTGARSAASPASTYTANLAPPLAGLIPLPASRSAAMSSLAVRSEVSTPLARHRGISDPRGPVVCALRCAPRRERHTMNQHATVGRHAGFSPLRIANY
jgi:hypothetical protein